MPAVTRSLMRDDSSSAIAPMSVNIALPMGAASVDLIADADKADAKVVEFLQRPQEVACAPGEAVELPNQNAIELTHTHTSPAASASDSTK